MSKLLLTTLFTLVFFAGFSTDIIQYSKSNKGLFGYNRVTSTYEGVDESGNRHWMINCHDPGLIKCNRNSGVHDNDLLVFADAQLEIINNQVDDEIALGAKNGTLFHKIIRNQGGVSTWVIFRTSWESVNGEPLFAFQLMKCPIVYTN